MPGLAHRSAHDTQHGIAAHPDLLWDFFDNSYITNAGVLIDYRFMNGTESQRQAVRSTIETSRKPPGADFVTWEDCANVKFREVNQPRAPVRIKFEPEGNDTSWSALGTDALSITEPSKPTMVLRGLPTEGPLSEMHRGTIILHEFGHVLGLVHEHQSPAMEGVLTLDEKAVIRDYGGNVERARRQVLDKIQNPTNYTVFDKLSIMVYPVPSKWLKTRWYKFSKDIPFNTKLSELDQAFIRLMYPPDLSGEDVYPRPFYDAMRKVNVPADTAGKMLKVFAENRGTLPDRLRSVRNYFNIWKEGSLLLFNPTIAKTIGAKTLRQSGVSAFAGEATKNKLFQALVRNIVYRAAEQHGIQPNLPLPGSAQNEVTKMLGALAMHDDVGQYIRYMDGQFSGRVYRSEVPEKNTVRTPLAQVNPREWAENAPARCSAHIRKLSSNGTITMTLQPVWKKAKFEGGTSFNDRNIDVKGQLHCHKFSDLDTARKVKWNPNWIVFYYGEWNVENFIACFTPGPHIEVSETDLGSAHNIPEGIRWQPI